MKKLKIVNAFAFLAFILSIAACKKDHGNYDYKELPLFQIDTSGMSGIFETIQNQPLTISPKIRFEGNESQLQYLWRLYDGGEVPVIDTLSNVRDFDESIHREPGNYTLELRVQQKEDKRMQIATFRVRVQSPGSYPSGWLIAYNEGSVADFDLITAPQFLTAGIKDTVYKALYATANGAIIPGSIVQLRIARDFSNGSLQSIFLSTNETSVQMSHNTFLHTKGFNNMFTDLPNITKPQFINDAGDAIVNNGVVYSGLQGIYLARLLAPNAAPYTAAPMLHQYLDYATAFYDTQQKRFLQIPEMGSLAMDLSSDGLFDVSDIGMDHLLYTPGFPVSTSTRGMWNVFKDDADRRFLLATDLSADTALAKINITAAPNIKQAKFFQAGYLSAYCLYADDHKIYRIQPDMRSGTTSINTESGFAVTGDEVIVSMKIFRANSNALNHKGLFVATWKETEQEGKLYLLPLNEVSGEIGLQPLKVWTGLGKIRDMGFK